MKKKHSSVLRSVTIILVLIVLIVAGAIYGVKLSLSPVSKESEIERFVIEENSSVKQVLKDLKEEDLIRNDTVGYYYLRFIDGGHFKAGKYDIDRSMNFNEICDYISDSKNAVLDVVSITFKEGEWLKEFAYKIYQNTNLAYNDIIEYWNNPNVIRGYMDEYPFLTEDIFNEDARYLLEGYLFPNTYEFMKETTLDEVTRKFLNETNRIYEKYKDDFDNSDLSIHEVFTLASVVQYEAANVEDMQMIAGVFFNRLAEGMPLQSSVTVCYSMDIDRQNDDWRLCETNSDYDSPYNTYKNKGLTPGPILNPGEEAIRAVLEPTESEYLFFMADVCHDGKVYYAKDYATHLSYVKKYLDCY